MAHACTQCTCHVLTHSPSTSYAWDTAHVSTNACTHRLDVPSTCRTLVGEGHVDALRVYGPDGNTAIATLKDSAPGGARQCKVRVRWGAGGAGAVDAVMLCKPRAGLICAVLVWVARRTVLLACPAVPYILHIEDAFSDSWYVCSAVLC
jgi:hypothetical protein